VAAAAGWTCAGPDTGGKRVGSWDVNVNGGASASAQRRR